MKKMLAVLLVAGIAAVPAGVYATTVQAPVQSAAEDKFGLADNVYGSFATMKQAWPSAKMEDYKRFNDKLETAQAALGAEEYAKFEGLVKQLTAFGLKYPGETGVVDTTKMTREELAAYQQVITELEPYFEKLNG